MSIQSRNKLPNDVTEEYALELYQKNEINKGELILLLVEIANKKNTENHFDDKSINGRTKKRTFK